MSKYRKDLQQTSLQEVLSELGLPPTSIFLGYVIHRPDTDEFVAAAIENEEMSSWIWTQFPQTAHSFKSFDKAYALAKAYIKAPLCVGLLFDLGDRLFFSSLGKVEA